MTTPERTRAALAALALCLAAASCGGSPPRNLRVSLQVTGVGSRSARALLENPSAVRITVAGARTHASSWAGPGDPGWVPCDAGRARRIDLMKLGDDPRELCTDHLPHGYYRQVWVDLAANEEGKEPANSLVTADGEELAMEVAGGGFGAIVGFLAGDGMVEVLLSLDPSSSVHRSPAGRIIFRPDEVRAVETTVYRAVVR